MLRRKKWSEAEERSLISKYGEMVCSGSLCKLKTREKKFRPIASHLNSTHHLRDPLTFPSLWTWKDVSTKLQNMRHQYSLVKQKLLSNNPNPNPNHFDWAHGLSHWSNFLIYKHVFGDLPLLFTTTTSTNHHHDPDDSATTMMGSGSVNNFDATGHTHTNTVDMVDFGHPSFGTPPPTTAGAGGIEDDGVLGLGFEYGEGDENLNQGSNHLKEDGDDEEEAGFVYEDEDVVVEEANGSEYNNKKNKKNKKNKTYKNKAVAGFEKKGWSLIVRELREMETRFEAGEVEREQERQRQKRKVREERRMEWEKESEYRENKRREEMGIEEREWEERMKRRRYDWKKRMDELVSEHTTHINQIQSRILDDHHTLNNHLLAILSQCSSSSSSYSSSSNGLSHSHTHTSSTTSHCHYNTTSQMMHHVNGLLHHHSNSRVQLQPDNQQGDHFVVDT